MRNRSQKLDVGRDMPPLRHKVGDQYDVTKSEVAKWLCSQPEIMEYVVGRMNAAGFITFDPETRLWTGIDYEPAKQDWSF
jgi:hypothetical protein